VAYVIGSACVDVKDLSCVEECPVDCIYEGERAMYIHPTECIDCGACETVCPVEAINYEVDVPAVWEAHKADNARFFLEPLPGREAPLASPGGAKKVGPIHADTDLVAGLPPQTG
jgi:NAD-dependent dihydropyrimidine dehydrogenase PreA subunit